MREEFYNCRDRYEMEALLVDLATKNDLSVTELLQLPSSQQELAGMIILGHKYQEEESSVGRGQNPTPGAEIPEELLNYRVTVAACGRALDNEYKYKNKIVFTTGKRSRGMQAAKRSARFGLEENSPQRLLEDNLIVLDSPAEMNLQDAWHALKQSGMHCVYAPDPESQKHNWLCKELPRKKNGGK